MRRKISLQRWHLESSSIARCRGKTAAIWLWCTNACLCSLGGKTDPCGMPEVLLLSMPLATSTTHIFATVMSVRIRPFTSLSDADTECISWMKCCTIRGQSKSRSSTEEGWSYDDLKLTQSLTSRMCECPLGHVITHPSGVILCVMETRFSLMVVWWVRAGSHTFAVLTSRRQAQLMRKICSGWCAVSRHRCRKGQAWTSVPLVM